MKDREKAELEISLTLKKKSFDRDLTKVNKELKKKLETYFEENQINERVEDIFKWSCENSTYKLEYNIDDAKESPFEKGLTGCATKGFSIVRPGVYESSEGWGKQISAVYVEARIEEVKDGIWDYIVWEIKVNPFLMAPAENIFRALRTNDLEEMFKILKKKIVEEVI